jgi:hypothetical protein
VNDTELMPALSTAFSDATASASDNLKTIFDERRAEAAAIASGSGPGRPEQGQVSFPNPLSIAEDLGGFREAGRCPFAPRERDCDLSLL